MTLVEHNWKRMSDETAALIPALVTENAELRAGLAEAQELLIETADDAGEIHAQLEEVRAELVTIATVTKKARPFRRAGVVLRLLGEQPPSP